MTSFDSVITPLPPRFERPSRFELVVGLFVLLDTLALVAFVVRGTATASPWIVGLVGLGVMASVTVVIQRSSAWFVAGPQLFVFLLFSNALVVAATFHGVPYAVVGLSYALVALPFIVYVAVERRPLVITLTLPLMFAYAGAMLLSAAFARDSSSALAPLQTFLLEGLLLYVLLTNSIRSIDALRRMMWVVVGAAAFLASLSVYQEFLGSYDNILWGFAQTNADALKVGEDLGGKVLRDRLGGPMGSPNRYAQILLVSFPFALIEVIRPQHARLRIAAGVAGLLILAAMLLTFSRGALGGVAAVLVVALMLKTLRLSHVVACGIAFALVLLIAVPDYAVRLRSLSGLEGLITEDGADPDGAIVGRATSNLAAFNVFVDHPLVGVGPLQYFQEYSQEYANRLGMRHFNGRRRAHNLYLEKAADTGIVGLAAFLAIPAVTGWQLWQLSKRYRRSRRDHALLVDSLLLSMVAYFSTALFLHLSYERYLWLLLALGNVAIWLIRREADSAEGGQLGSRLA